MARSHTASPKYSSAATGSEANLWLAPDKLRNNTDAAEYDHVVVGPIVLKHDFENSKQRHVKPVAGKRDCEGSNPEKPDKYRAETSFRVLPSARRPHPQNGARRLALLESFTFDRYPIEGSNVWRLSSREIRCSFVA